MAARCGRADLGEQPEEGSDDCVTRDRGHSQGRLGEADVCGQRGLNPVCHVEGHVPPSVCLWFLQELSAPQMMKY